MDKVLKRIRSCISIIRLNNLSRGVEVVFIRVLGNPCIALTFGAFSFGPPLCWLETEAVRVSDVGAGSNCLSSSASTCSYTDCSAPAAAISPLNCSSCLHCFSTSSSISRLM